MSSLPVVGLSATRRGFRFEIRCFGGSNFVSRGEIAFNVMMHGRKATVHVQTPRLQRDHRSFNSAAFY